jgi:hypothetical protein
MVRCGCALGTLEQGFIKKKLSTVKNIFTIFSVVELKIIGATFAYLKRPSVSVFLSYVARCMNFKFFQTVGKFIFFEYATTMPPR